MRRGGLAALVMLVAQPAMAAECALAHATYGQSPPGIVIQFFALEGDAAPPTTTHLFEVHIAGMERPLFGDVEHKANRNTARITRDCPPDAPLGDGSEECPFWRGAIHAGGENLATPLPDEYAPAPATITLPKLGPALAKARFDGVPPLARPVDTFALRGCSS